MHNVLGFSRLTVCRVKTGEGVCADRVGKKKNAPPNRDLLIMEIAAKLLHYTTSWPSGPKKGPAPARLLALLSRSRSPPPSHKARGSGCESVLGKGVPSVSRGNGLQREAICNSHIPFQVPLPREFARIAKGELWVGVAGVCPEPRAPPFALCHHFATSLGAPGFHSPAVGTGSAGGHGPLHHALYRGSLGQGKEGASGGVF